MKAGGRYIFGAAIVAVAASVGGCDNMEHQTNPRTLGPAPQFTNGAAARHPPAHVVALGSLPSTDVHVTGFVGDQPVAQNPEPITPALLARGQERFVIYCTPCHGPDGYAQGIVVRRGFPPPPSYHDDRLRSVPDGHIFDVITRGYGVMLPFGSAIAPADRWAIVAYIRALQRSQHAAPGDVPAGEIPANAP